MYLTSYLIKGGNFVIMGYEVLVIENTATTNIVRYLKNVAYINVQENYVEHTKLLLVTK